MNYRFSGHESFPFRYSWLPKAYRELRKTPSLFSDESQAMVELGVGKNMVRAIRFWVQVTGVAEPTERGYTTTEFGDRLLSDYDSYLEDIASLWLLHWNVSTQRDSPLFAWHYLLNRWQHPEISRNDVLRAFCDETDRLERKLSEVTLSQHFDVFLHTYVSTAESELGEDALDCPLTELHLIQQTGERVGISGRREPVYAFRREMKPDITPGLFVYCLNDFWDKQMSQERTVSFRDACVADGSPGQIFKLPEYDLRDRLEHIEADSGGLFTFEETMARQVITREGGSSRDLLAGVYGDPRMNS